MLLKCLVSDAMQNFTESNFVKENMMSKQKKIHTYKWEKLYVYLYLLIISL